MIIKRIYFPDATYSHNENEFKRFIKTFGLSWYESAKKVYVNANNVKLLTGIYISADQNRRIFAFYEGYEKPVTMIVKILGSGGNFLIDLNMLCSKIGCNIDDRDKQYLEDLLLRLKNFGDIGISEDADTYIGKEKDKGKGGNNKKLEDFKLSAFDIKIRRLVRRHIMRFLINCGESSKRRGISMKVMSHFKKEDIKNNITWGLENGWIR